MPMGCSVSAPRIEKLREKKVDRDRKRSSHRGSAGETEMERRPIDFQRVRNRLCRDHVYRVPRGLRTGVASHPFFRVRDALSEQQSAEEESMTHDEFVGQVQHRAQLPSRGDAEAIIRAALETLGERLQRGAALHLAAQLPPEIGRHLRDADRFVHLSVEEFYERVAQREDAGLKKAIFHAQCVFDVLCEAVSPGAVHKLREQLPAQFHECFTAHALA
jgi:uncharacterized protein (DUF2267 family)